MASLDSFNARQTLTVGDKEYTAYSLVEAEKNGLKGVSQLPFSMKVLLENLLRYEDGRTVTKADIEAVVPLARQPGQGGKRDRLPPRPGPDAGLHRRSGRRRPRGHARRHEEPRRRPA